MPLILVCSTYVSGLLLWLHKCSLVLLLEIKVENAIDFASDLQNVALAPIKRNASHSILSFDLFPCNFYNRHTSNSSLSSMGCHC